MFRFIDKSYFIRMEVILAMTVIFTALGIRLYAHVIDMQMAQSSKQIEHTLRLERIERTLGMRSSGPKVWRYGPAPKAEEN